MNLRENIAAATAALGLAAALAPGPLASATPLSAGAVAFANEPACHSLTPVSQGGPAPKSPNLVVMRWLGTANVEIAYRGDVFLLDAFYTVLPEGHPLGFSADQVRRATAILVDHAHGDHFGDVPRVAKATGAPVYGAPVSIETALRFGVPQAQTHVVTGKGGELLRFNGVTVEPILMLHNDPPGPDAAELGAASKTAAEAREQLLAASGFKRTKPLMDEMRALPGTFDQRVITEGTIAYLFTFPNGYKIFYRDAAGMPTTYELAAKSRIGSPDVGLFAYSSPLPELAVKSTMQWVRMYKPGVVIPIHHDDVGGTRTATPTEPLAMAVRDQLPHSRTIAPLYRTPMCFDIGARTSFVGG